ncbi:molybdopterin-binding protein [Thermaerobacillus caldiproteolyticus]|uniref:hypothetical protein n=1 Tax=Thermaerobacillus caldiproteolyticus TaxID=247480 RepID=UPI002B26B89C|nr:hypothetical protein [Anoxybacillus caldiproteolyticus]
MKKVEISVDDGKTWEKAALMLCEQERYAWIHWHFAWNVREKGEYTILVKATDSSGRTQPSVPIWNRKGYGYNAIQNVHVKIE